MRVLMVTPRFWPHVGGVETHVHQVGRRLVRAGVDLTVLATDPDGTLASDAVLDGIDVRRVPAYPHGTDLHLAPGIIGPIAGGEWDIVHVQGYHTLLAPLAMLAARLAGRPYVVTLHSGGHSSGRRTLVRPLHQLALRPLLMGARRLVAVSAFEAGLFRRRLRLSSRRLVVIPNGSELPVDGAPAVTAQPGLIVSPGRLERYKGHGRVIEALPEIVRLRPDARLMLVGSGPDEPRLRELAATSGVADRIEFTSVPGTDRAAMARLLREASLVVALSDYESQGLVVAEAIALGRPVLAADATALSEYVEAGLAEGVPLDASAGLVADRVVDALDASPGNGSARRLAAPLPTWDDTADRLLALYRSIDSRLRAATPSRRPPRA
jgi:glycogen synthase